jgi:hypothetical protein
VLIAIIGAVQNLQQSLLVFVGDPSKPSRGSARVFRELWGKSGQVAQVVERSPEKAGVGGSTPSLATTFQRCSSPNRCALQ